MNSLKITVRDSGGIHGSSEQNAILCCSSTLIRGASKDLANEAPLGGGRV